MALVFVLAILRVSWKLIMMDLRLVSVVRGTLSMLIQHANHARQARLRQALALTFALLAKQGNSELMSG